MKVSAVAGAFLVVFIMTIMQANAIDTNNIFGGGGIDANDLTNLLRSGLLSALKSVPYVGNILSTIVGLFWPTDKVSIWSKVKDQVKDLVDTSILEAQLNEMESSLKALRDDANLYALAKYHEKGTLLSSMTVMVNDLFEKIVNHPNADDLLPLLGPLSVIEANLFREKVLFGKILYDEDNQKIWDQELQAVVDKYQKPDGTVGQIFKVWQSKVNNPPRGLMQEEETNSLRGLQSFDCLKQIVILERESLLLDWPLTRYSDMLLYIWPFFSLHRLIPGHENDNPIPYDYLDSYQPTDPQVGWRAGPYRHYSETWSGMMGRTEIPSDCSYNPYAFGFLLPVEQIDNIIVYISGSAVMGIRFGEKSFPIGTPMGEKHTVLMPVKPGGISGVATYGENNLIHGIRFYFTDGTRSQLVGLEDGGMTHSFILPSDYKASHFMGSSYFGGRLTTIMVKGNVYEKPPPSMNCNGRDFCQGFEESERRFKSDDLTSFMYTALNRCDHCATVGYELVTGTSVDKPLPKARVFCTSEPTDLAPPLNIVPVGNISSSGIQIFTVQCPEGYVSLSDVIAGLESVAKSETYAALVSIRAELRCVNAKLTKSVRLGNEVKIQEGFNAYQVPGTGYFKTDRSANAYELTVAAC